MNKIKLKKIPKSAHVKIKKVEKRLKDAQDIYVDKTINKRIEREISHLGKEKLIVDHINNISNKLNKKNKNKVLFLLVKLFNYNKQVNESLIKELEKDKLLLAKRINANFKKKKAHKDVYKKLLNIANKHYEVVKNYADNFNPKKKYPKKLIVSIVYHKRKAEMIYKALANIKNRKTLHKVLIKKLDEVYKNLINSTSELSSIILHTVKAIESNKFGSLKKKTKSMESIVTGKMIVLRNFAYKYTYNIIHDDTFLDIDNHKIVIVSKKL